MRKARLYKGFVDMIRLTYISSVLRGLPETMTDTILAASRANNRRAGVTGLLIYDGVRFLQVLEGDEAAVLPIFERIQADPRHRACVLLERKTIETRAFGDWDMAWCHIGEPVAGATLAATVDAMTAAIEDRSLRALLTGFARIDRAA